MSTLSFETGQVTYSLNGASEVRFNPTDSAFAQRLFEAFETLEQKQEDYQRQAAALKEPREIFAFARQRDLEMRELLDEVLEDMENEELNAQLKATMEEKQAILGRLGALQQDEEQRAGQEARLRELAEWLKQQKSEFTEYDDTITRRYVERITVVDAETIRIKFRYTDVEIDRAVRT